MSLLTPGIIYRRRKGKTASTLGEWELSAEINGQTRIKTTYEYRKGNVSKFTKTTYEMTRDGKTFKVTYSIITYPALITKKEEKQIVFDEKANGTKNYITTGNNTLIIAVDTYDGPSTIFKRML